MKKLIFTLLAAALMTACRHQGYVVEGELLDGKEGSTVYLTTIVEGVGALPLDSTTVKKGRFAFKGRQDTAAVRFLFYHNREERLRNCMLVLENARITLRLGEGEPQVQGTRANEAVRSYYAEVKKVTEKYNGLQNIILADSTLADEARRSLLENMLAAMQKEVNATLLSHIVSNLDNPLGAYLLCQLHESFEPAVLLPLFDKVAPIYRNERLLEAALLVAEKMKRAQAAEQVAVGKMFAELELPDRAGAMQRLSQSVGANRLTLLDFWAGWCRPCLLQLPAAVEIYNRYKKDGLGWVGLSLDVDSALWCHAIDSLGLPGTQLCDLQGGASLAARRYGVVNIPRIVLIGNDGVVLESDVPLDALEEKIKQHLKK